MSTSSAQGTDKDKKDKKAAWLRFIEKVMRGEAKDEMGQYVSDDTQVEDKKQGDRLTRPKYDAALAKYPAYYGVQIGKELESVTPAGAASLIPDPDPTDPLDPCFNGACDPINYPPPPVVYGSFESSETRLPPSTYTAADNPAGYIMDLKIATNNNFTPGYSLPPGDNYTLLEVNLNRGAGGTRIYLGFTRKPAGVAVYLNEEPAYTYGIRKPVSGIQVKMKRSWNDAWPSEDEGYNPIYNARGFDTGLSWSKWEEKDLNDGAGGWYIHAYQSKVEGGFSSPFISYCPPIEVGVLYGNSASIQPPIGWTKINDDLNKGAGGDYIYFCTKQR